MSVAAESQLLMVLGILYPGEDLCSMLFDTPLHGADGLARIFKNFGDKGDLSDLLAIFADAFPEKVPNKFLIGS